MKESLAQPDALSSESSFVVWQCNFFLNLCGKGTVMGTSKGTDNSYCSFEAFNIFEDINMIDN